MFILIESRLGRLLDFPVGDFLPYRRQPSRKGAFQGLPFCRHLPEVLVARLAIYHGLKKWDLLAVVAKRLTAWNPKDPGFFVELAYATRRAESIHAAHAIPTRAAGLHPNDPTIQFNLACYEAQMGSLNRAKAHLKRATEIDAKFKLMALEDPDLEPLWASLAAE